MGKLRSGRIKRIPQIGITSDRYEFLGLNQAEPNLGDPNVGISSVGINPIKAGAFYQLAAIAEYPGERFWSTQVGIGSTLGVISVYANNELPNSAFERIHGLNFVGTGVTIETPPLELFDGIGIATIRFTVTDIQNRGEVGQVLYNTSSGYTYGASELYYVSNNVGIGSTIPQYKLDILGDTRLDGKLSVGNTTGVLGQYLSATGTGVTWSNFPVLRTGLTTIATVGQTGFTTSYNVGFLDVYLNGIRLTESEYVATDGNIIELNSPCFGGENVDIFAYGLVSNGSGSGGINGGGGIIGGESYWVAADVGIHTLSSVGIGTTNPTSKLTVNGDAQISNIKISGTQIIGDGTYSNLGDIKLIPNYDMISNGQYVKLRPTTSLDQTHIHIEAGNVNLADLYLGDDDRFVKIDHNGPVVIGVPTSTTTSNWTAPSDSGGLTSYLAIDTDVYPWAQYITVGDTVTLPDITVVNILNNYPSGNIVNIYFESAISYLTNDVLVFSYRPRSEWKFNPDSSTLFPGPLGIGITNPTEKLTVDGAVLASGGFISIGNTTPIQITLVGNQLTFSAVGIGSTTLTLS